MSKISPSEGDEQLLMFATDGFDEVKSTDSFSHETTTFNFGGNTFFATYWRPKQGGKPKGLVFLCHGYAEYISPSYDEIAEALAEMGFLVFGHDHVGHGRSSGQRVQVNSMADYVQPLLAHVKKVQRENGGNVPTFVIGHSMGGLITVNAVLEGQEMFSGMVLMGPLIKMDPDIATPVKKVLAKVFQSLIPSFSLGELDHTAITRDEQVVKRVKEDHLGWHGGFRARHSHVLLEATDALADGKLLHTIKIPALIMQGGLDKLVLPAGASFCHENLGSEDKKLLEFPEAFHNLFVELEDVKNPVIKETCDWLIQHA